MAVKSRKTALIPLDHYQVHDAINTVGRAREHLSNPKMVRAMKARLSGLNEAVTGGLKPKAPRPNRKIRGGL